MRLSSTAQWRWATVVFAATMMALVVAPAIAEEAPGCCEYVVRAAASKQRSCAMLAPAECRALSGRLFHGFRCDARSAGCTRGSAAAAMPTATPSPTPQLKPTVTPMTGSATDLGCCQVNRSSGPLCDDAIPRGQCDRLFDGQSVFCAGCHCSGRPGPRFDFNPGTCVQSSEPATRPRRPRPNRSVRPARPH